MRRWLQATTVCAVLVLVAAGCGGSGSDDTPTPAAATGAAQCPSEGEGGWQIHFVRGLEPLGRGLILGNKTVDGTGLSSGGPDGVDE